MNQNMTTQQHEVLIFANDRPSEISDDLYQWAVDAEDMIRRLHAESELHLQELASYRFTVENRDVRIAELEAQLAALQQGLIEVAQAVIDRWDSPLWKDVPATAEYIARLRNALAVVSQSSDVACNPSMQPFRELATKVAPESLACETLHVDKVL